MDSTHLSRIEARLGEILSLRDFRITSSRSASAGLSRTVILLSAISPDFPGERGYALLVEQAESPVAPNWEVEFAVLRALQQHPAIKAPIPYWIERDGRATGSRFLVTTLLPGIAQPRDLLAQPYEKHGPGIVSESFSILGKLAALDYAALRLPESHTEPDAGQIWEVELDRWEDALRNSNAVDRPVTAAAIRSMRNAPPPPPPKVALVHGDYRVGNFLFDSSGVTGVLDWEMAHPGNPLEDLAWALLPNWEFASRPGLAGGFLTPQQAIGIWQNASGIAVDPASLRWWTMLCHVKAVATWAAMRDMFVRGVSDDSRMAMVSYGHVEKQESHLVRMLS